MVKIRLQRGGCKKKPHYRLVAVDSRSPRDGKFLEILGHYHPTFVKEQFICQEEKVLEWLAYGAQPTNTARDLIRKSGILAKFLRSKREKKIQKRKYRHNMKELIEYIVSFLVEDQKSISVNKVEMAERIILELYVNKEDLRKIIGKEGKIIQAMRYLVSTSTRESKKRYLLEIIE